MIGVGVFAQAASSDFSINLLGEAPNSMAIVSPGFEV